VTAAEALDEPGFDEAGFDEVAALLAATQGADATGWRPEDRLDDVLVWDSLAVAEALELFEERGRWLAPEAVASLSTLGDVAHYLAAPGTRVDGSGIEPPRLVPMTAADEPAALRLHTEGGALTRYRLRGTTPSPEQFHRFLWDQVLVQHLVVAGTEVIGMVTAFEADHRNRHAHVAAIAAPAHRSTGLVPWALLRFVDELFATFDLRKLYAEVLEPNLAAFGSGLDRRFAIEGRLRGHEYVDGDYVDLLVLATTPSSVAPDRERRRVEGAGEPVR